MKGSLLSHLQNGINRMLPFVTAGALFMAFGGRVESETYLGGLLQSLGVEGGMALMLPVLAGFVAHSMAGWDGFLPGMIGGLLAALGGSGMLGGILAGYLAGYLTLGLSRLIRLPAVIQDLQTILILPILSTLGMGLLMISLVNPPISALTGGIHGWLGGLQGESTILLGIVLGGMGAFDLGGPVNKAAALFALDMLAVGVAEPLGAVVAGAFSAPLAIYLATRLVPRRFSSEERKAGTSALLLGLFNIAEGAIPITLADPGRIVPAITLGGAVAGAIAMATGVGVRLPVGGFLTMLLPGMVTGVGSYLLALGAGTVTAGLLVSGLKVRKASALQHLGEESSPTR